MMKKVKKNKLREMKRENNKKKKLIFAKNKNNLSNLESK